MTNTNQMVTSLLRNMGGFGGRDNWKRREKRGINNSKVKVLLVKIVEVYKNHILKLVKTVKYYKMLSTISILFVCFFYTTVDY